VLPLQLRHPPPQAPPADPQIVNQVYRQTDFDIMHAERFNRLCLDLPAINNSCCLLLDALDNNRRSYRTVEPSCLARFNTEIQSQFVKLLGNRAHLNIEPVAFLLSLPTDALGLLEHTRYCERRQTLR